MYATHRNSLNWNTGGSAPFSVCSCFSDKADRTGACGAANALPSPPLHAAAIFSSDGMLEAAMTAERERGVEALTLRSPDAGGTQQSAVGAGNPHRKNSRHQRKASGVEPTQGQLIMILKISH